MSVDRHNMSATSIADVKRHLLQFAQTYPELPLYRRICEAAAQDDEVAGLLLAARPGQARPVLLLAALHDHVLAHPDEPAARWYPSVNPARPDGDPWPDVRSMALNNADEIRQVIATHATQTNEVNRAAYLAPLLAIGQADEQDRPVALLELGASAGLLLNFDSYDVHLGPLRLGDPASDVHCRGDLRNLYDSTLPPLPQVIARHGLDLHPISVDNPTAVRWLEACLWPDVPGRLERFRAAVRHTRQHPVELHRGSMVEDLPALLDELDAILPAETPLVVFSSWALTYVAPEQRAAIASALETAATRRPVTWLTAEPPGAVPGIDLPAALSAGEEATILGVQRWRDGKAAQRGAVGSSHAHGNWVDLRGL